MTQIYLNTVKVLIVNCLLVLHFIIENELYQILFVIFSGSYNIRLLVLTVITAIYFYCFKL